MVSHTTHIIPKVFLVLVCTSMALIGFSIGVLISDSVHNSALDHANSLNQNTNFSGEVSPRVLVPWTEEMRRDLGEIPLNKT